MYQIKLTIEIPIASVKSLVNNKDIVIKMKNKWYDKELSDKNKAKYQAFHVAHSVGDYNEYRKIRNEYKKLIKLKKKQLYSAR